MKEEYEAKHGGQPAAMLRGILNPAVAWQKGGGAPAKGGSAQQVATPEETPAPQRHVYS